MARISDRGLVPWYAHPKYRAADERELANNIYGDLGSGDEQAVAHWRRAAFDRDLRYIDHVLRTGADVPEDEPRAEPPRRQTTDAQKAYALWGREQEREANEAAQQDIRQRWHDFYMESSIFERKRR
jgi:hypothetical protein